jgi:uncharacterized protein YciI
MITQWRRVRFASLVCAAAIAGAGYVAFAQQPKANDPPRAYANAIKKKMDAYVVLLRLRHDLFLKWQETGKFPDDKEASKALAGHGEYWQKQLKDGHAVLAGGMKGDYWDNAALIIFEAGSEAEANTIAKNDPAVKAYVFQAQVRPFDVFFITNKFQTER